MKKWIVILVLGVPFLVIGLLLAFISVTVAMGIEDPLQPLLGPLHPYQPLALWLWLVGAAMALGVLAVMAWFAPWGVLFRRRAPRKQFRAGRKS